MPSASAPFPWPGNKGQLADGILDVFPRHETYIDVFGGSGALIFEKTPAPTEIYNDADEDLVHFMRTLRDEPTSLVDRLRMIPYARELHQEWTTDFFEGHRPSDDIERAARYYFVRRAQYGGEAAKKVGFRATVSGRRNPARQWRNSISRLSKFADRLIDVNLSCRDYRAVLDDAASMGQSALVYCDPPYQDSTHRYQLEENSQPQPGAANTPSFDFDAFTEAVREIAARDGGPRVVVSTDVLPATLESFHCVSQESSYSMNATGGSNDTTEYLITNFDPSEVQVHSQNASLAAF